MGTARLGVLGAALVTAIALTCAGAAAAPAPQPRSAGPYADNDTAAERHAETVAYAKQIIAERPVLDGETAYSGAVPKHFRQPDEFPGAANRIGRSYYATMDESPHKVYKQLTATTVTDSQLGGYGDVGAGPNGPRYAAVRFDRTIRPDTMVDGELIIEVQGYAHKPTLLAEFSWAVPHPAWPTAERVPTTAVKARVTRVKYSKRHRVLARHRFDLASAPAASLATAFDNSWIAPPWTCTGVPITGPYVEFHVRLRADGHTWLINAPGFCGTVGVVRSGIKSLPGVNASKAFTHQVRQATRS